jgi:hypothetical protein
MSDMGYENSLTAGEEHVLVLRPHWKPLLWPVVAVLIVAEVLIPSGKGTGAERLGTAVVAILLPMGWLMYSLAPEVAHHDVRAHDAPHADPRWNHHPHSRDIPFSLITDVSFRKGLLDGLLGCGTLVVESADDHGELVLTESRMLSACRPRCPRWRRTNGCAPDATTDSANAPSRSKRRRRHTESTARQLPPRGAVFSNPVSPTSRHANQIFGRAASAKLITNAIVVIREYVDWATTRMVRIVQWSFLRTKTHWVGGLWHGIPIDFGLVGRARQRSWHARLAWRNRSREWAIRTIPRYRQLRT